MTPGSVVHALETRWLYACLGLGGLIWLGSLSTPQSISTFLMLTVSAFFSAKMMASRNMAHGIQVTERQLPDLYAMYKRVADRLGMPNPPPLVVMQQGGVLNAFALKAGSRHQVVLTSTLLTEAGKDHGVVEFILGHELGHHLGGHTQFWRFALSLPLNISLVPLALAWKRKQEFTADRFGLLGCGNLAASERAMKLLMAGSFGLRADTAELQRQAAEHHDVFHWLGEISTTHPAGATRIEEMRAFAATQGMAQSRPGAPAEAMVQ